MSHFTTVKTELRDRQALVEALSDLGHAPEVGALQVRGYRGQTVTAELAVCQGNGADIGFRLNPATGSYELVTDLDLWSQAVPVERFSPSSASATPCVRFWPPQPKRASR